ncbi:hypothetical protein DDE83_003064 [Stemphylium lycopersici]|uniref:Uncharacterized protein n=1 Tax=Stemphylium lycopersici TaxID=183478 RepID=A0A364N8T3_STELY|nr:hypothetical protein DDE83_003064 [Stemphylium lycopersici]
MSTTPTAAEEAPVIDDESTYHQDDRGATLERRRITASSHLFSVTYRHSAVQTLPPANAHAFGIIYGRKPTERETVKEIGTAAIGRYQTGLAVNPYNTVTYAPFVITQDQTCARAYNNSCFQTCSVAQCTISLARAKAKASVLVSKQRNAAQDAGYKVWVEENDAMIAHAEQHAIRIQFDEFGSASTTEIYGMSLPNICGEEIQPESEDDRALTTDYTAMPGPPPPLLTEDEHDRLHLRPLEAKEPFSLETEMDHWALENYGYIEEASGDCAETWGWEETGTDLGKRGTRLVDQFVVYDPTPGLSPAQRSVSPVASVKLKKKSRKRKPRTSTYRKDEDKSQEHQNTLDQSEAIAKATPEPKQSRERAFSTQSRDESKGAASREYSRRNAQFYGRFTGEKSRSPANRHHKTHYRSRSPTGSVNTSECGVQEDKNLLRLKEAKCDTRRAREAKGERRQEREAHRQEERAEILLRQGEAEIKRARQENDRLRQEVEEKRQMREAARLVQERTDALPYPRGASLRQKCNADDDQHTNNQTPPADIDQYTLARAAEDHRRKLAQAQLSSESPLPKPRGRSSHNARQSDGNARRPEKKVEDGKVTKTRGKRGPRRELERYDPRKKFGAGSQGC